MIRSKSFKFETARHERAKNLTSYPGNKRNIVKQTGKTK